MSDPSMTTKNRMMRYALVVAAAAAVSFPLVSQGLRAQDEAAPAGKATAADEPADRTDAPAAADEPRPAAGQDEPAATDDLEPRPDTDEAAGEPDEPAQTDEAAAAEMDEAASKVVVSAGDLKVTVGDIDAFISTRPPEEQQQIRGQFSVNPQMKRQLVEHLLKMKALAREAEKLGLDEKPNVEKQLRDAREQIMAGAMVASLGAEGEAGDKAYFEEHKDSFGRVQARHILVATRNTDPNSKKKPLTDAEAKKKAEEIRARLEKGEDFAALAKAESDDPGSKETGGTYTFGRGEMVPAFEQSAYSLKVNEISQPIKTQFGYHVIQLQKRIPVTFEEARARIGHERLEAKIRELMGAEPKYDESYFGGAAGDGAAGAEAGPADKRGEEKPRPQRPAGGVKGNKK